MTGWQDYRIWIASIAVFGGIIPFPLILAQQLLAQQVVPDTNPATTLNSSVSQPSAGNFTITGGTTGGTPTGAFLFHSFEQFSVPTSGEAFFNNAATEQNIFSRVTGGSVSDIDGQIRTANSANVFLLNPNGIIFGANASLNIGGSFVATTASAIQFGTQGQFDLTTSAGQVALLTVDPSALLFNQAAIQPIVNRSTAAGGLGLSVPSANESLSLVGGEVRLEGGRLDTSGGRISITGLAAPGTVTLNLGRRNPVIPAEGSTLAAVTLTNNARVRVDNPNGISGDIFIRASAFTMAGRSQLNASSFGTSNVQAGVISLDVTGATLLEGDPTSDNIDSNTIIQSRLLENATGNSGNTFAGNLFGDDFRDIQAAVFINTGSLTLTNGAYITTSTRGQGNAGGVFVSARGAVSLSGRSQVGSTGIVSQVADPAAQGNAGAVFVAAESLSLTNEGRISTSTIGRGNAGLVFLRTTADAVLDNAVILSTVEPGATGQGGFVRIDARSVSLTNGTNIQVLTRGDGNAGDVVINATEAVRLSGSSPTGFSTGIFSSTEPDAVNGRAGSISVTAPLVQLADAAVLSARTQNSSEGGFIQVRSSNLDLTNGGQILTTTYSTGDAGDIFIRINGGTLRIDGRDATFEQRLQQTFVNAAESLRNLALARGFSAAEADQIAQEFGPGYAVQIFDNVAAGASGLFANTSVEIGPFLAAVGQGGTIFVDGENAANVMIANNGAISVSSEGLNQPGFPRAGDAGGILITIPGDLTLDRGEITARARQAGGGAIIIQSNNFIAGNSSLVSTSVRESDGDGGNVVFVGLNPASSAFLARQDSDFLSTAEFGTGGNIIIRNYPVFVADIFARVPRSGVDELQFRGNSRVDFSVSSRFGVSGNLTIPNFNFLENSLAALQGNLVNTDQVVASSCVARRNAQQGSFVVTGTGGLPRNPDRALDGWYEVPVQPLPSPQGATPSPTTNLSPPNSVATAQLAADPGQLDPSGLVATKPSTWRFGDPVQEAQGLVITTNGMVILGSQSQTSGASEDSIGLTTTACN